MTDGAGDFFVFVRGERDQGLLSGIPACQSRYVCDREGCDGGERTDQEADRKPGPSRYTVCRPIPTYTYVTSIDQPIILILVFLPLLLPWTRIPSPSLAIAWEEAYSYDIAP